MLNFTILSNVSHDVASTHDTVLHLTCFSRTLDCDNGTIQGPSASPHNFRSRNSVLTSRLTPSHDIRIQTAEYTTSPSPTIQPIATVTAPDYLNEAELHVFNKIQAELEPVKLEVQDISGGCGSMYAIEVESPKFKGLTVIKQHKMVNEVLKDEIKSWHGVQLRTKAA
ncbi:hypothetical protein CFE70_006776 [Pyrenophora teres f. teres 0-1]